MRRAIEKLFGFAGIHLGLTRLLLSLTELVTREKLLAAFTYHRITDRSHGDVGYLIYDVGIDHRAFEIQVTAIAKYFRVVGLDSYVDFVSGRIKPEKRSAILTFDDADGEFSKHALPILARHHYPGVVFAPTDYIGSERRFWHLRVTNLISGLDESTWEKVRQDADRFAEPIRKLIRKASVAGERDKGDTCRQLVYALDEMEAEAVESIVNEMEGIAGAKYTLGVGCMDWQELQVISQQNVKVESHTVSHRKLARLGIDEIRDELAQSKRVLEEKLGSAITAICYPAGSHNDCVVAAAAAAGYRVGFTTQPGFGSIGLDRDEIYRLRRLSMYGEHKYEAECHIMKLALKRLFFGKKWVR